MSLPPDGLLGGPLSRARTWPLLLRARCCELRPVFLPKGQVGRHHRAISRNGRVLLASDRALADLPGAVVRVRLQTWHRAILPGDVPEPHGVLLCVRTDEGGAGSPYEARLAEAGDSDADLLVDVGALRVLEFRR